MKIAASPPPSSPPPPHRGWVPLPAGHLPAPTAWPAGFALGMTFVFWGLIASWVVLAVGGALLIASLAGWIAEIRHERNHDHS